MGSIPKYKLEPWYEGHDHYSLVDIYNEKCCTICTVPLIQGARSIHDCQICKAAMHIRCRVIHGAYPTKHFTCALCIDEFCLDHPHCNRSHI